MQHQISQVIIDEICEWAIMQGVAIKNKDKTARHCPFSIAPMTMLRHSYEHLLHVTPLIAKLISAVSEDHVFLQQSLAQMAKADPFFGRLLELHAKLHKDPDSQPLRQPLLLMRTDFMDDRQHGAKVIEFNGIAAGMGPFGNKATQLHNFVQTQFPKLYQFWIENPSASVAENNCLAQLSLAIANASKEIKQHFQNINAEPISQQPVFLMVVQKDEDNVYDQHLLEAALQGHGIRTVRRTFAQLSQELSTGENKRLVLKDVGGVDLVYLRAGYQYSDYWASELAEQICCQTLSLTRLFIEEHHVAVNATISQQLATSKTMQLILTMMDANDYQRFGLTQEEAKLVKSVFAPMKPVTAENIEWFTQKAIQKEWVLKNQGEGGGHCIFGEDITPKLAELNQEEYDAWLFMQRLYPHERDKPTLAIRDGKASQVNNLVSEIGLFTAYYNAKPATDLKGYAGYLVRSKPAQENEGGVHSGKGMLDSITLIETLDKDRHC